MDHTGTFADQAAFDKVWNHFVVAKAPAAFEVNADGDVICKYRGPNGAKCAAGVLLPDELYQASFEGQGITHLSAEKPNVSLYFRGVTLNLLSEMQIAHDRRLARGFFVEYREEMKTIATTFGLKVPSDGHA